MKELLDKLLNQRVVHSNETLGTGTIIKYDPKQDGSIYIYVLFDKNPSKECPFLFPGIFTDSEKRMSSESASVNYVIQKIIADKACEICQRTDVALETWQNRRICKACIRQFKQCECCNKPIHPKEASRIIDGEYDHIKYYVCKECEQQRLKCPECGNWHYPYWRKKYYPWIPDENAICLSCAEDRIMACHSCEKEFFEDEMISIDGFYLCQNCFQTATNKCKQCGRTILNKKSLCYNCEKELVYEKYLKDIANILENDHSKVIHKTLHEFRCNPHTDIINRLSKCSEPYAECLLIDIGGLNLVMVYLGKNGVEKYYAYEKSQHNSTMTTVRTENTSNDWWTIVLQQKSKLFPSKHGNKFRAWERPIYIRGRTDADHRWDFFVSGFYVIGTWRKHRVEDDYSCNNKSCPFTDCEKRLNDGENTPVNKKSMQIDMQCICPRYNHYIVESLNKKL